MMTCIRRFAIACGVTVPALLSPIPGWSWGADEHHAVAELASPRLSPLAAAAVARLLALEPGATFSSISTWADSVPASKTAKWHYVNFETGDCHYDEDTHCPDGHCVVGAIEHQAEVLANSHARDSDRLKALKYLVHFVGDVHQPLHAGYAHDRGGNKIQVRWNGHGTNLHSLWDVGLIQSLTDGQDNMATQVLAKSGQPPRVSAPARWAEESCRIVQTPGFYPDTIKPGRQYLLTYGDLVLTQIDLAAWRLAATINDALRQDAP